MKHLQNTSENIISPLKVAREKLVEKITDSIKQLIPSNDVGNGIREDDKQKQEQKQIIFEAVIVGGSSYHIVVDDRDIVLKNDADDEHGFELLGNKQKAIQIARKELAALKGLTQDQVECIEFEFKLIHMNEQKSYKLLKELAIDALNKLDFFKKHPELKFEDKRISITNTRIIWIDNRPDTKDTQVYWLGDNHKDWMNPKYSKDAIYIGEFRNSIDVTNFHFAENFTKDSIDRGFKQVDAQTVDLNSRLAQLLVTLAIQDKAYLDKWGVYKYKADSRDGGMDSITLPEGVEINKLIEQHKPYIAQNALTKEYQVCFSDELVKGSLVSCSSFFEAVVRAYLVYKFPASLMLPTYWKDCKGYFLLKNNCLAYE